MDSEDKTEGAQVVNIDGARTERALTEAIVGGFQLGMSGEPGPTPPPRLRTASTLPQTVGSVARLIGAMASPENPQPPIVLRMPGGKPPLIVPQPSGRERAMVSAFFEMFQATLEAQRRRLTK